MNQAVFAKFKAYYLKEAFVKLIQAADGENKPTAKEFWKSFNIKHAEVSQN
jgi:hypothetical protein